MKHLLAFLLVVVAMPLAAQSCFVVALQKGQAAYEQGDYAKAAQYWEAGKKCDGADINKLDKLLWKTRDDDRDGFVNGRDKCPKTSYSSNGGCPPPKAKPQKASTEPFTPSTNTAVPPNMVLVRGGTYTMGDLFNEGSSDEKPTHSVTVSNFYIGKYEVTFDEFDAFCTATGREKPRDGSWGRGRLPVINVDWYDAVEYCNWRSQNENLTLAYSIDKNRKDPNNQNNDDTKKWTVSMNLKAKGYRLPTEAEWEFAAREGGKKVRFGNGRDIIDPLEINFKASAQYKTSYSMVGKDRQKSVSVDDLSANSLGLKHMSGNVWEWCYDWHSDKYYSESDGAHNPSGPTSGRFRVLRGGSWAFNSPWACRVTCRHETDPFNPNFTYASFGFRVVRGY